MSNLNDDEVAGQNSLVQQNVELRRRLDEEHSGYRCKLQTYQNEQQKQAQLIQKLQAKVDRRFTTLSSYFKHLKQLSLILF